MCALVSEMFTRASIIAQHSTDCENCGNKKLMINEQTTNLQKERGYIEDYHTTF